ncbi:hypothetical protein NG798_00550 [Ancylothrix sp. C2]|uniref:hypothetical protein n=1 Tax=Ancylothrix sp. D3o TaxID=2953691 RepID=UPI0021BB90BC|nr:hypothetical protein [Ancylothrix sp. D3o]MCT7948282.1 hypothetical protein [Ancylothrix sp. D3o]
MDIRDEKTAGKRNDSDRQGSMGCFRPQGAVDGVESHSVNNSDGARTDGSRANLDQRTEGNIGKIVGQLRELQRSHLAYVEAHEERLRQRLEQAKKHHQQILGKMQEMEAAIEELIAVSSDEEHF